jgi:hypothetical protein
MKIPKAIIIPIVNRHRHVREECDTYNGCCRVIDSPVHQANSAVLPFSKREKKPLLSN